MSSLKGTRKNSVGSQQWALRLLVKPSAKLSRAGRFGWNSIASTILSAPERSICQRTRAREQDMQSPTRVTRHWIQWVIRLSVTSAFLAGLTPESSAKTLNQVPFRDPNGSTVVDKLTRSYAVSQLGVDLFGDVGGAVVFTNGTLNWVYATVAVDPAWSRLLYSVRGGPVVEVGSYGGGLGQFRSPQGLDVTPEGSVYIAD